jgi:hypothetical protein
MTRIAIGAGDHVVNAKVSMIDLASIHLEPLGVARSRRLGILVQAQVVNRRLRPWRWDLR